MSGSMVAALKLVERDRSPAMSYGHFAQHSITGDERKPFLDSRLGSERVTYLANVPFRAFVPGFNFGE